MKYSIEQLEDYIAAMNGFAAQLPTEDGERYEFHLCINNRFCENWSSINGYVIDDGEEVEFWNDDIQDQFYKFQDKYLADNGMDNDILALSFIHSGVFNDFVNNDS